MSESSENVTATTDDISREISTPSLIIAIKRDEMLMSGCFCRGRASELYTLVVPYKFDCLLEVFGAATLVGVVQALDVLLTVPLSDLSLI